MQVMHTVHGYCILDQDVFIVYQFNMINIMFLERTVHFHGYALTVVNVHKHISD